MSEIEKLIRLSTDDISLKRVMFLSKKKPKDKYCFTKKIKIREILVEDLKWGHIDGMGDLEEIKNKITPFNITQQLIDKYEMLFEYPRLKTEIKIDNKKVKIGYDLMDSIDEMISNGRIDLDLHPKKWRKGTAVGEFTGYLVCKILLPLKWEKQEVISSEQAPYYY